MSADREPCRAENEERRSASLAGDPAVLSCALLSLASQVHAVSDLWILLDAPAKHIDAASGAICYAMIAERTFALRAHYAPTTTSHQRPGNGLIDAIIIP